jgi:hypothetical protein
MDEDLRAFGRKAVERLDYASAEHPDVTHADINDALACVVAFRNLAIAKHRDGEVERSLLDRANAALSLAYGCEFPLAGVHRHRMEQARDAMRDLIGEVSRPTG